MHIICTWQFIQEGHTQRNSSFSSAAVSPQPRPVLLPPPPLPPFYSLEWASVFYNHSWGWGQLTQRLVCLYVCVCVHVRGCWSSRAWCVSMSGCRCEERGERGAEGEGRRGEEWRRVEEGRNGWWLFNMITEQPYSPPPVSIHSFHLSSLLFISTTVDLFQFPLPVVHFRGN